jgi:DnaJ-class molecular chaperone
MVEKEKDFVKCEACNGHGRFEVSLNASKDKICLACDGNGILNKELKNVLR